MQDIDIRRNYLVVKSNELIQQTRYELTTLEQKIILRLIQMIEPNDTELKTYLFDLSEFCELCGIDMSNGGYYIHLKNTIKNLHDKSFWIKKDNKEILCSWIAKASFILTSSTIEIRLDEDLRPYLLDLKNNFTSYSLYYILSLNSKYSIRFYEFLKSQAFKKSITIPLEDLKTMLNVTGYERFFDFKKNVIDVAINEINERTDIKVSYQMKIHKRNVTHIIFVITPKTTQERIHTWGEIERALKHENHKTNS